MLHAIRRHRTPQSRLRPGPVPAGSAVPAHRRAELSGRTTPRRHPGRQLQRDPAASPGAQTPRPGQAHAATVESHGDPHQPRAVQSSPSNPHTSANAPRTEQASPGSGVAPRAAVQYTLSQQPQRDSEPTGRASRRLDTDPGCAGTSVGPGQSSPRPKSLLSCSHVARQGLAPGLPAPADAVGGAVAYPLFGVPR